MQTASRSFLSRILHAFTIALATAVCTSACGDAMATGISAPAIASVKLERTACYGACSVYTVEIRSDGTVTYQGKANVKTLGNQRAEINPRDFEFLVAAVQRVNFFGLRSTYSNQEDGCAQVLTDAPSVLITIQTRDGEKTVNYNMGCEGLEILGQINWLADTIDEVAGTRKWAPGDQTDPVVRENLETDSFRLRYRKATDLVALLTDRRHCILSDRGTAAADKRANTVVFVRDTPLSLRHVRALVEQFDVPGNLPAPK